MATIRGYTTIEQSRKLAEILPLESADMCYPRDAFAVSYDKEPVCHSCGGIGLALPAWSLVALLGVLPYGYSSILTKSFNGKDYYCKIDGKPFETYADNPVDACYEMVIRLNKLKML